MADKAKVICLTPVRNESWIIKKFLKTTNLWADHLIILDHCSKDGTREIINQFKKNNNNIHLIEYNNPKYEISKIRSMLLKKAREISGKKLLVGLDADEFMSANILDSNEWQNILYKIKPGTVLYFKWPFIYEDLKHYWGDQTMPFGFMDDGSTDLEFKKIHEKRIPIPSNCNEYEVKNISILHYQYTDWERMKSKHKWYQCYEKIQFPNKNPIDIYRKYHHMDLIKKNDMQIIPKNWFENYEKNKIDINTIVKSKNYWWDRKVEELIEEYGKEYFKYIDLTWNSNLLLKYLRKTHKYYNSKVFRGFEKIIKFIVGGIIKWKNH